ncbi:A/G-specific adenine glycosylase [Inhella gelatinilytica]|uniref:Adenine DNA glycosylase n=1 Tax=Inhella gelatinilytica TaxID=2795030 RepID=A0A931IRF9_9BURK|nr:A/G-specific adenine glycosylase [Inhella gelatinilytica]MBH9551317.1 A/G-specific adenine glycosylase [Inhella gelatinilytica]
MPAALTEFSARLLAWQRQHGRHDLPWCGMRDPYRVWLSEIMLQQTQVATVRTYYARFLARFPSVDDLAAAPLDEVLALWAGLGYYTRARNLHACAQAVVALGGFPRAADALEALPGIGRSTARAIASFCFEERVSILDGNVRRVLARLLAWPHPTTSARAQKELWAHADALLPPAAADMPRYTQGLMDLGALVCTPRGPRCGECPVAALCAAQAQGRVAEFPLRAPKPQRGRREQWWLWLERESDGALWLQQRPSPGVWAGLWSLPLFDAEADLRAAVGLRTVELLPRIDHALTHFDWVLHPRQVRWSDSAPPLEVGQWVSPTDRPRYGMPAPLKKLLG